MSIAKDAEIVGFAIVPNWIVRDPTISWNAKIVYLLLTSRQGRSGSCFPSQKLIAHEMGIGETSVKAAVKELKSLGVLRVEVQVTNRGRHNRYIVGGSEGSVATRLMGESPSTQEEESLEEESTLQELGGAVAVSIGVEQYENPWAIDSPEQTTTDPWEV